MFLANHMAIRGHAIRASLPLGVVERSRATILLLFHRLLRRRRARLHRRLPLRGEKSVSAHAGVRTGDVRLVARRVSVLPRPRRLEATPFARAREPERVAEASTAASHRFADG